jgi:hypothetical protein
VALLGKLIKGAVQLGNNLIPDVSDPMAAQQATLKELLTKASETAFGKQYRFGEILQSENSTGEFARIVPVHDIMLYPINGGTGRWRAKVILHGQAVQNILL